MTQRLSALFIVLLAVAFCTAAMADSIPGDPNIKIIPGGHSTPVEGTEFGPFFPFAGASAGADCVIDPAVTGDAFCSFANATEGTTFNQIAITITGELNPISCFNLISPGGGCRVDGTTITFFDLGIPPPDDPTEWNWDFQNTFNHAISASFTASDTTGSCTGPNCTFGVPEPASALLVGSGLMALLALTRRWNLRRSKT